MDIWNSFEVIFSPNARPGIEDDEQFFIDVADALNVWEIDRGIDVGFSSCDGIYTFSTIGDINPKVFVPLCANIVADAGGQGELTSRYVTSILDIKRAND